MDISRDSGEIEQLFIWKVLLPGLPQDHKDVCVTSPPFRFLDSILHLFLGTKHEGWIGFYLRRVDSGSPMKVKYALEINTADVCKTFTNTHIFESSNASSGEPEVLKMSMMNPLGEKIFHELRITCRIVDYSSESLQESPNRVTYENQANTLNDISCAIQKAIPNSVSCAIETRKPNSKTKEEKLEDTDRPLLYKKSETLKSVSCAIQTEVTDKVSCANQTENLNNVSCAIQTQIPDSFSCEVQTEIPDSETDKENSEDESWSSLDREEVKILRGCLKELLTNGNNQDVTIYVQDREFRVHRSILRSRSPVFDMMLTHDNKENNTGTINIEDCDPESFEEFLLYVYSGRTGNITPSKAIQLYYAADKYDFPVLKERCVSLLKTFLSITLICDIITLATEHGENELLEMATEFFARNIKEIIITVAWQSFMTQNPIEANELLIKSVNMLLP